MLISPFSNLYFPFLRDSNHFHFHKRVARIWTGIARGIRRFTLMEITFFLDALYLENKDRYRSAVYQDRSKIFSNADDRDDRYAFSRERTGGIGQHIWPLTGNAIYTRRCPTFASLRYIVSWSIEFSSWYILLFFIYLYPQTVKICQAMEINKNDIINPKFKSELKHRSRCALKEQIQNIL